MISLEKSFKDASFDSEVTHDKIFSDDILIAQHKKGYRFNADSILLSWFIFNSYKNTKNIKGLEIGSGTGVIPIVLSKRGKAFHIDCIEMQEDLYKLLKYNIENNHLSTYLNPLLCDFRVFSKNSGSTYDIIFTNPPYFHAGGKMSPDSKKACSRHEVLGSLKDFFELSYKLLASKGVFYFIYPVSRIQYALANAQANKLYLKEICFFQEYSDTPPSLFAAKLTKGDPGASLKSDLVLLRNRDKSYTETGKGIMYDIH